MPLMMLVQFPGKTVQTMDPQTLEHDPSIHECNPYKTLKDRLIGVVALAKSLTDQI